MGEEQPRTSSLVDTTDCLEAVSVVKCWKNFLFIIILLGLLLLQGSFWVMHLHKVNSDDATVTASPVKGQPAVEENQPPASTDRIKKTARQVTAEKSASAEPNVTQTQLAAEPNQAGPAELKIPLQFKVRHIVAVVRFLNVVLMPGALLYCLTMLFSLKLSLIGRLGGINHITRAFFLSLFFVVLLLPWQLLFAPLFAGALFTPDELIAACQTQKNSLALVSFYLRFTGYWLLVVLLLVFSQIRSMRWARATLRRLEVV